MGNVIKDVYLNLDSRTEQFETDRHHTQWLNLSFNASEHHFYHRNSNLGGAAISLEVLQKFGLSATISDRSASFFNGSVRIDDPTETYRYILVSDGGVCYLAPSQFKATVFTPPFSPSDYLFVDRSAHITRKTSAKIISYLESSSSTKLVLYMRNFNSASRNALLPHAHFIFTEHQSTSVSKAISDQDYAPELAQIDPAKIIYLSDRQISHQKITEHISPDRIDIMTHLSIYSIAAATILGGLVSKMPTKECLKLARINVENSKLDSVLSLSELQEIASQFNSDDDLELIAANLLLKGYNIYNIKDPSSSLYSNLGLLKNASGVVLSDQTLNLIAPLTARRIVPGIEITPKLFHSTNFSAKLREYYIMGLRFAKLSTTLESPIDNQTLSGICHDLAKFARDCQSAGLVPLLEFNSSSSPASHSLISETLSKKFAESNVNPYATIFRIRH